MCKPDVSNQFQNELKSVIEAWCYVVCLIFHPLIYKTKIFDSQAPQTKKRHHHVKHTLVTC